MSTNDLVKSFARAIYIITVDDSTDDAKKKEGVDGIMNVIKQNNLLTDDKKKKLVKAIKKAVEDMSDEEISTIDWLINSDEGIEYVRMYKNKR